MLSGKINKLKKINEFIPDEVRKGGDENRWAKMVVQKQGAWTNWNSIVQRKIKWSEIWHDHTNLKFLMKAVYDILPRPTNLCTWHKTDSALFPLCKCQGSLRHILSRCPTAPSAGRYRWRHEQMLKVIADRVCTVMGTNKFYQVNIEIEFFKASTKPDQTKKPKPNILSP